MKPNMSKIFESIQISDEVKRFVDHSFDVANKIHELLEKQGKTQRDLASLMGKKESEISKWMQGTHNFTLKSIAKIESVLGESLFEVLKPDEVKVKKQVAVFYNNFMKQNEFLFKKSEIINQLHPISTEFKKVMVGPNQLNQKSEVVTGESSFSMAA
ncbi:helix-turn-helix domain-containing protein [Arthrospiribacter ruber]|uniref:XRE family transcriptional regulator n=1 Tax=Arthrospiribacter ruber TaxID=2487934 RepID=A0A951IY86_9BACT|nr:helix-turn-helix transcriptional regulator [Arthrospiribacter ruber]MBW3467708.1 XRE family transcriptional regulator [Arthrospiribacter ruber]